MRACFVFLLALSACHHEPPAKIYSMRGVVVHLDIPNKLVSVKAEKIPGWMDAMTMDYAVHDAAQMNGLAPGDHITATVHVKEDLTFWMDHVAK